MSIKIKDSKQEPSENDLSVLNQQFHKGYKLAKQASIQRIKDGSVMLIVRMDSRLFIMNGEKVDEHLINKERYHSLKAAVHTTLAAFYNLTQNKLCDAISDIKKWTKTLRQELADDTFALIADATDELIVDTQQHGAVRYQALTIYSKQLESVFSIIMMKAADDEIANIVEALDAAYEKYDKSSADIFMVVFGGHQPRYRELAKLVFKKWFNELDGHLVNADHHVRYLEGGESLEDAVNLIATEMTDSELALIFMGSSEALNQDALGVVAQKSLVRYWANRNASHETQRK